MADIKPSILSGISKLFKDILGGTHAEVVAEMSLVASSSATSQKVAMTTSSAKSTLIDADYVVLSLDAAAFLRQGPDTGGNTLVALSDGTDQYLPAGIYRVAITRGNKLAFIMASGTGNAYITPGA